MYFVCVCVCVCARARVCKIIILSYIIFYNNYYYCMQNNMISLYQYMFLLNWVVHTVMKIIIFAFKCSNRGLAIHTFALLNPLVTVVTEWIHKKLNTFESDIWRRTWVCQYFRIKSINFCHHLIEKLHLTQAPNWNKQTLILCETWLDFCKPEVL